MSSSTLRNSPSPPSYSPITDPTILSVLPNSPPFLDPISLHNSDSQTTVDSSSLALSNKSSTTYVPHSSVPQSLIFSSSEENSLEAFALNGRKLSSVNEIFDYINQQPAENRWSLTENLLKYRKQFFASLKNGTSKF